MRSVLKGGGIGPWQVQRSVGVILTVPQVEKHH